MYRVSKQNHSKYGNVVEITREDSGEYQTPFQAANKALNMRRLWKEEIKEKIKLLVDGQILTPTRLESWANEEYKSLPKCEECGKILTGDVYTHRVCGNNLFCSRVCADKNYDFILEKMNDNDEHEYDL